MVNLLIFIAYLEHIHGNMGYVEQLRVIAAAFYVPKNVSDTVSPKDLSMSIVPSPRYKECKST